MPKVSFDKVSRFHSSRKDFSVAALLRNDKGVGILSATLTPSYERLIAPIISHIPNLVISSEARNPHSGESNPTVEKSLV